MAQFAVRPRRKHPDRPASAAVASKKVRRHSTERPTGKSGNAMGTKLVRRKVDPAKLPSPTKKQKADLATLSARPDSEIDFSDIPPLTENFWKNAVRGKYYKATKPGVKTAKRKSRLKVGPFDAAEYLDSDEVTAEYLTAALEDRNPDVFLHAAADIARARGISMVAKHAGLGREQLCKTFAPGAKIQWNTVRKILDSLGLRLTVTNRA